METPTTKQPIDFLQDLLPNISRDQLLALLQQNHYDLRKTISYVLYSEDNEDDKLGYCGQSDDQTIIDNSNEINELSSSSPKKSNNSQNNSSNTNNSNNNNNSQNNSSNSNNSNKSNIQSNTTSSSTIINNPSIPMPCKFFVEGACANDKCKFIHDNQNKPQVKSVCRYYLIGQCFVKNCPFLHSSDAIVCKFWLQGGCFKQDCTFSHSLEKSMNPQEEQDATAAQLIMKQQQRSSTAAMVQKHTNITKQPKQDDFPELFSKKPSVNTNNGTNVNNTVGQSSLSSVVSQSVNTKTEQPPQFTNFKLKTKITKTTASANNNSKNSGKSAPTTSQQATNVSVPTSTSPSATSKNKKKGSAIPIQQTLNNKPTLAEDILSTTQTSTTPTKPNQEPAKSNSTSPKEKDSFPTLHDSLGIKSKPKNKTIGVSTGSMNNQIKIGQLQDMFKHVNLNDIVNEFEMCENNFEVAKENLLKRFGNQPPPPPISQSTKVQQDPNQNKANYQPRDDDISQALEYGRNIAWSDTGTSVAGLYSQYRDQAILHARERNRCFDLSLRAFNQGDGEKAKMFSLEGRKHDKIMKDLHAKAKSEIFQQRNMHYSSNVLDLHGLHVSEALDIIDEHLGITDPLYLIIGTGHHTHTNQNCRLPTRVKKYLVDCGYTYRDCSTDKREGMIMVIKN